jgi:cytochrome c peroxidase
MTKSSIALLGLLSAIPGCENEPVKHRPKPHVESPPAAAGVEVDSAKLSIYAALPESAAAKNNPLTDEKVALGRMLYFDARLSKSGELACATCHDLDKAGADGKDFSIGAGKKALARNTPTVLNAAVAPNQFWDGRSETVEDAAKAMLLDPTVMASTEARVADTLKSMPEYAEAFKKAFPDVPDPVTLDGASKAIGAFTRKLVTPSRWDKFIGGDKTAITDDEKKGFLKFVDVGCPTCHVGALVGATMFQKLGKEKPWPNQADKGRSAITKSPSDDMMFRVSQLRNVEYTYFHDASGKTLEEAVKTMATYQLAKELSDEDVKSVTAFLKTLSGQLVAAADFGKKPALPASTPKTPKAVLK